MWATVAAAVTAVATAVVIIVSSETAACSGSSPNLTAASNSPEAVQECINDAVDGDIITIPDTSATWTSGVVVPSGLGITITGTGTPSSDVAARGASASCNNTVITDNFTSSPDALFKFQPTVGSSLTRISCIQFFAQGGLGSNALYPPIVIGGTCNSTTCSQVRVDNLFFDVGLQAKTNPSGTMLITDNVFGVMDHNTMDDGATGYFTFVNHNNSAWDGVGVYGDNSWATPLSFGTAKTLYLENNVFGKFVLPTETEAAALVAVEGSGGGRVAVRFNDCNGCANGSTNHGTESNGRPRGGLQMEYYGNDHDCNIDSIGCQGATLRSGVILSFGNTFSVSAGGYFNSYVLLTNYRSTAAFAPWGACDGTSAYDDNDATTFFSDTIDSGGGTLTFTFSPDPGWTPNQWVVPGAPYSLHNVTQNPEGSQITANTSNTLTVAGAGGSSAFLFANSDSVTIRKANICTDQASRSDGDLVSMSTPSPAQYTNQALTPSYEFNNTGPAPSFGNFYSQVLNFIANRDWYTDNANGTPDIQTSPTSPFNGSSGVGFGTIANRPTTCTAGTGGAPGVGYYATDEGSWNTSGNGFGQGQFYRCTSTNNWTLYYTPYSYPHPLIDAPAGGGPPAAEKVMIR